MLVQMLNGVLVVKRRKEEKMDPFNTSLKITNMFTGLAYILGDISYVVENENEMSMCLDKIFSV